MFSLSRLEYRFYVSQLMLFVCVYSSMTRSGVDITYLTSRIAVMSYPGEGLEMTTSSNCAEDVRALLESKHHGTRYSVYNVSRRSYSTSRIGRGRVRNRTLFQGAYQVIYGIYFPSKLRNNLFSLIARKKFSSEYFLPLSEVREKVI